MPVKLDFIDPTKQGDEPIVFAAIQTMVNNYATEPFPEDDAKSAWVSVSEVLQLIADNNGNGIRIYYGRHSDDDGEFAGLHNVILVATRDTTNPDKPTPEGSVDLLNDGSLPGIVNSVSFSFTGNGDDAIPLCPPRCPIGQSLVASLAEVKLPNSAN